MPAFAGMTDVDAASDVIPAIFKPESNGPEQWAGWGEESKTGRGSTDPLFTGSAEPRWEGLRPAEGP